MKIERIAGGRFDRSDQTERLKMGIKPEERKYYRQIVRDYAGELPVSSPDVASPEAATRLRAWKVMARLAVDSWRRAEGPTTFTFDDAQFVTRALEHTVINGAGYLNMLARGELSAVQQNWYELLTPAVPDEEDVMISPVGFGDYSTEVA